MSLVVAKLGKLHATLGLSAVVPLGRQSVDGGSMDVEFLIGPEGGVAALAVAIEGQFEGGYISIG